MKKIFIAFAALSVFVSSAFALPSKVETLYLKNGIPVYFQKNDSSRIDALCVVVKGGTALLTDEENGLESVVFDMMSRGSEKYSYSQIQKMEYETNANIGSSSMNAGSLFSMTCIDYYFDRVFSVFADCFMNPAFNEDEFATLTREYVQSVSSSLQEPETSLDIIADRALYKNHPYSKTSSPDYRTIGELGGKLEAVKALHKKYMNVKRLALVAVGDYDKDALLEKLNASFGNLEYSEAVVLPKISLPHTDGKNRLIVNVNSEGTGHVMHVVPAPVVTNMKEYVAARLAASIYSDILYNVVRENMGVCYTPSAFNSSGLAPYGGVYYYRVSRLEDVQAAEKKAEQIMAAGKIIAGQDENGYVLKDLGENLEGYINSYLNGRYAGYLTCGAVCGKICGSLLTFGDPEKSFDMLAMAEKVTAKDIQKVFRKYWMSGKSSWYIVCGEDGKDAAVSSFNAQVETIE